jgi:DNA-binding LacI/PurR family transcriptional regulator
MIEMADKKASTSNVHVRPVTMKDVARAVGVSQSTVSRILSNAPLQIACSPETRTRVEAAARDLGYRPNPLARALRGARTMLLGVIVRDITDPFFGGAIESLSTAAGKLGYNIVLGLAHGSADEATALAALLEARHCDAIIVLGDMDKQPRLVRDLVEANVPVVAIWQGSSLHDISTVNVDNRAGIRAAMAHLRELGHGRIAFVSAEPLGDIRERRDAYFDQVDGNPSPGYLHETVNNPAAGAAALRTLMKLPTPPTAVIASTDQVALGMLHEAHEMGVSVPRDLSVVGFDDIPLARFAVPGLTTLRMPTSEMVAAAVKMATDYVTADPATIGPEVREFVAELIVRGSTGPPIGR